MHQSKKRKRDVSDDSKYDIDDQLLADCENEFLNDRANIIARNVVTSVGSTLSTMDSRRVNNISHIFINTVKKKNLKATNQGSSGRCWLFGGLNMFRHHLIHALGLDNFEFSEVYLFFWDKLERSNQFLSWFINHPEYKAGDRPFDIMLDDFMTDGGWWNFFANLVDKYGLVPQSAMQETFQSNCTEDMNQILEERLRCAVNVIRNSDDTKEELIAYKNEEMKHIYGILVKFLGEPPKTFSWAFTNDDDESQVLYDLTPESFTNMVLPHVKIKDFVAMCDSPTEDLKHNQMYEIKYGTNVYNGCGNKFLNININEISKYAAKSILAGMPVWFVADVSKNFNPYHSTLDDQLHNTTDMFGNLENFSKGDRITLRNLQGNHAMCLTGVNLDNSGVPESWQVENSWGYYDHETRGEDGWLTMSHSWFKKNIIQIVVHKNFLSRTVKKFFKQKPILLEPWDAMAPATKAVPRDAPKILNIIRDMKRKKKKQKTY